MWNSWDALRPNMNIAMDATENYKTWTLGTKPGDAFKYVQWFNKPYMNPLFKYIKMTYA